MKSNLMTGCFLAILLGATSVYACDCAAVSEKEEFENATIVFEGELIRSERVNNVQLDTLRVLRLLKGVNEREITIRGFGSNCDYLFEPNVVYLIYARKRDEGDFRTSICSSNKIVRLKKEPPPATSTQTSTTPSKSVFLPVLEMLGAGFVVLVVRFWSKSSRLR